MLGKNLISSVLTQIPVFILGVVSGVFSTRILGEDAKGVFSLFQANTQLFVLVFSLGIQTGIVYFVSSKKIAENLVAGMSIRIFLISSSLLLVLLILLYFTGLSQVILSVEYTSFMYLAVLFLLFAFTFINALIASFFQAHSKFRIINLIAILNSIFNALLFAGIFIYFQSVHPTPSERFNFVLFATLISLILNSSLWMFFAKRELKFNPDYNFTLGNHLKKFISYNLLIYLGMFVNFFNYRLDLWIVNNYLDEKDLSYYSLAANINQIILYLAVTIASVMLPNFSSKGDSERNLTFVKISRICFSCFTLIIIAAFLISPFIIPLMYGDEFDKAVLPFRILMPGILFSSITQLFSIYIVSVNRNVFNIIACSAGLIFTVVLDILLIPQLGIAGAAIATSISYFAIFFITYIFVVKQTGKATLNFFIPKKEDIRFVKQFLKQRS